MEVDDSHDTLVNKSEENDFEKKGTSDPVVYQLVRVSSQLITCFAGHMLIQKTQQDISRCLLALRNTCFKYVQVEGDGTLVPATEDDVLQFDLPPIEDVGHVEEFFNNDCMLLKKPDLEGDANRIIQL